MTTWDWRNYIRKNPVDTFKKHYTPFSNGLPDNPSARAEYEWMRLHDPLTGKIPPNIREKELIFAAGLPKNNNVYFSKRDTSDSKTWKARGPFNIGGRTRTLAMDVTDSNILLAGGVSGGIWRSTDLGKSWIKTTAFSQLHSVNGIAQDKRQGKTNVWYYGTGETEGNSASGGYYVNDAHFSGDGIYKSSDSGKTWQRLSSTYFGTPTGYLQNGEFDYVWRIVTDSTNANEDEVYAAVYNGIYRSIDGGNSWIAVLGLDTNASTFSTYADITITSTGVLYATLSSDGVAKGIWRSTNGVNWTNIIPSGWPATFNRTVMGIAPSNENVLYFLSETPGSGKHDHNFWKYTYLKGDGTDTNGVWENRSANLPTYSCTGFYEFEFGSYSSQGSYDMYVKVKPNNENIVFLGGTNIYRSTDGFASNSNYSWIGGYYCDSLTPSNYVYPGHHPDQHDLLFLPSGADAMISASDGGMSITLNNMADSVAWSLLNNGYITSQFYTVAIEPGNTSSDIIIGGMQDNGTWLTTSTHKDTLWKNTFYGDGAYCAITQSRQNYYVSWQGGKTFKFTIDDNGKVTGFTRIDPSGGSNYMFINPFILDPNNNNIMYLLAGNYIWRNDDLSEIPLLNDEYVTSDVNWVKISQSVAGGISTLSMSKSKPNRVYYGTRSGKVYRLDSANTTEPVKTTIAGINFPAAFVSCVTPDQINGDKVMVVFSNYNVKSIFYTEDAGASWASVSGNLEDSIDGSGNGPSVRWAEFLHIGDSTIYYVGTSTGLYATSLLNGDSTIWTLESPSLIGNMVVEMLATRDYDSLIVAATHGNGIYSIRLGRVNTIPADTTVPVYHVGKSYPNPFSSTTIIDYEVLQETEVVCKVFNISGREVAELVHTVQVPGKYSVTWDGKNNNNATLSKGIYFYRIKTGDKVSSGKMVKL